MTLIGGCRGGGDDVGPGDTNGQGGDNGGQETAVKVEWHGHATFRIISPGGVAVVTDPYPGNLGYGSRRLAAELVTVSHEHFDHNSVASVDGDPDILRGLSGGDWAMVEKTVRDLSVHSITGTYHDTEQGAKRGKNSLFLVETGGLRILHLGDLGAVPAQTVIDQAGRVDVLLIPVGGYFTIDGPTASSVAEMFGAKIVIPMHFKTQAIGDWQISDEIPFIQGKDNVKRLSTYEVEIDAAALPPSQEIWVLEVAPED